MKNQQGLLLLALDRYEAHGWPLHRLADRLGVGPIVLATLDVGLHVARRHQTHLMTELADLARPVVCAGTGLDADQAGRQVGEEFEHLAAAKLSGDERLAMGIDAVHLEHGLGKVEADRGHVHAPVSWLTSIAPPAVTADRVDQLNTLANLAPSVDNVDGKRVGVA